MSGLLWTVRPHQNASLMLVQVQAGINADDVQRRVLLKPSVMQHRRRPLFQYRVPLPSWPRPAAVAATPSLLPMAHASKHRVLHRVRITGIALGWIASTIAFGAVVRKPYTRCSAGDRLGLCAAVALVLGPDTGEGRERSIIIEPEPDDVFLFGLGVRLWRVFREAVERNKTTIFRLEPGGENVLGMFVTGGPPVRGGGGMPQRIIVISRSPPELRTTGAG